jgi:hypothetical protein
MFAMFSPFDLPIIVVEDFLAFVFICALQLQRPPAIDVKQPKLKRCPPLMRWPCASTCCEAAIREL